MILFVFTLGYSFADNPNTKFDALYVYEVDPNNKLSLVDSSIIYEKFFDKDNKYNDTTILQELIDVSYPSELFFKRIYYNKWHKHDTTQKGDRIIYRFFSWCTQKDTIGTFIDSKGETKFNIKYDKCKIVDILTYDEDGRLVEYTYSYNKNDRTEKLEYNEAGRLSKIENDNAYYEIYYDKEGKLDFILTKYDDLIDFALSGGKSIEKYVKYQFVYE